MTWIGYVGPIAGVLALIVTILNALRERRGQGHTERMDDERLGHADLVAALEHQRAVIADLRTARAEDRAEFEREVAHWQAKFEKADEQASALLWMIGREGRGESRP